MFETSTTCSPSNPSLTSSPPSGAPVPRLRPSPKGSSIAATVDVLNLQNIQHGENSLLPTSRCTVLRHVQSHTSWSRHAPPCVPQPLCACIVPRWGCRPMLRTAHRDLLQRPGAITEISVPTRPHKARGDRLSSNQVQNVNAENTSCKQPTISLQHTTATRRATTAHSVSTRFTPRRTPPSDPEAPSREHPKSIVHASSATASTRLHKPAEAW